MCVICMYICVNVCKCYGNLRVQSTVLDGLQGSFGGPWGVLWGSWGSCGGPRRSEGVLGRAGGFQRGSGRVQGGVKNMIFSFFRGEFVNGLMKYWCFQFWVILWGGRWSLRYATFYRFWKLAFCETVRWICYKNKGFLNDSNKASSDFNENMMPKTWFREVNSEAQVDQFWWKSLLFLNNYAFAFCIVFEWITKCGAFARKWNSEYLQGRRAKIEILMNYSMEPECEIVNIRKDL